MESRNSIFWVVIVFFAVVYIIFNMSSKISTSDNEIQMHTSGYIVEQETQKSYSPNKYDGVYVGTVNRAIPLGGKTKDEIYLLRKKYVESSIFAKQNYKPSDEVYGGIESGKPWISQNVCKNPKTNTMRVGGISEEARFIANPNILVALEYPFPYSDYPSEEWCANSTINMVPVGLKYDGRTKVISVYYSKLPFPTNDGYSFYQFNGLNARDLGYKYAYVDMAKSTFMPRYTNSDNIGNRVIEFQNFLHLGGSCGVAGGCNNGSPRQPYLEFKQAKTNYMSSNGVIYIKLWKNRPTSVNNNADLVEKIIIKEY